MNLSRYDCPRVSAMLASCECLFAFITCKSHKWFFHFNIRTCRITAVKVWPGLSYPCIRTASTKGSDLFSAPKMMGLKLGRFGWITPPASTHLPFPRITLTPCRCRSQVMIPSVKLDFSHVQAKCGSLDKLQHTPGGGNVSDGFRNVFFACRHACFNASFYAFVNRSRSRPRRLT